MSKKKEGKILFDETDIIKIVFDDGNKNEIPVVMLVEALELYNSTKTKYVLDKDGVTCEIPPTHIVHKLNK